MQERIVEILIFVLNEVRKTNKSVGEIDLSELEQQGYTQAEISTAFSWLSNHLSTGRESWSEIAIRPRGSFRMLHRAEQFIISPEAYGYLIQLRELRIISEQEMEMVIERAMLSGFERLSATEMQAIVASVLFDGESSESQSGRTMFNSSDTVN